MHRRNFCTTGLAGLGTMAFSKTAGAMDRFFKSSEEKKWVVLYGSQCGSTREYANYINEGMGEIADVVDIEETVPGVDDYDFFVIGGWRNANNVKPDAIPDFIEDNKEAWQDKLKGLFIVLGNNGNPTISSGHTSFLDSHLVQPAGVSDVPAQVLFGRSDPSCNHLQFEYDNVSQEAGVTFGEELFATAVQSRRSVFSQNYDFHHLQAGSASAVSIFSYHLPVGGSVHLTVCNLNGRILRTLVSGYHKAGNYRFSLNKRTFSPGLYLCRFKAEAFSAVRTLRVAPF